MLIHLNGQNYDCVLLDDGTLDTVVRVNGDWVVRFDSDCARPPVCTVHGQEVTTAVCHECLKAVLGVAQ